MAILEFASSITHVGCCAARLRLIQSPPFQFRQALHKRQHKAQAMYSQKKQKAEGKASCKDPVKGHGSGGSGRGGASGRGGMGGQVQARGVYGRR